MSQSVAQVLQQLKSLLSSDGSDSGTTAMLVNLLTQVDLYYQAGDIQRTLDTLRKLLSLVPSDGEAFKAIRWLIRELAGNHGKGSQERGERAEPVAVRPFPAAEKKPDPLEDLDPIHAQNAYSDLQCRHSKKKLRQLAEYLVQTAPGHGCLVMIFCLLLFALFALAKTYGHPWIEANGVVRRTPEVDIGDYTEQMLSISKGIRVTPISPPRYAFSQYYSSYTSYMNMNHELIRDSLRHDTIENARNGEAFNIDADAMALLDIIERRMRAHETARELSASRYQYSIATEDDEVGKNTLIGNYITSWKTGTSNFILDMFFIEENDPAKQHNSLRLEQLTRTGAIPTVIALNTLPNSQLSAAMCVFQKQNRELHASNAPIQVRVAQEEDAAARDYKRFWKWKDLSSAIPQYDISRYAHKRKPEEASRQCEGKAGSLS